MLKVLTSANEYMDFINEINSDPDFCDPMLHSKEEIQYNLLDAPNKPAHQMWGIFDKEEMVGLSRTSKAYEEMLSLLKEKYKGYQVDFVYNPNNHLLHKLLRDEKTEFYAEQQKMVLKRAVSLESEYQIELYSPKYREQYISIHGNDGYWAADKVIDAPDRFRIILAIEHNEVVGYIDVTHKYDENEPYDIFVKEEYRNKGYGKAMLARAIELNKPKDMTLLVEVDNTAAIALFKSMGFIRVVNGNSKTAHVLL